MTTTNLTSDEREQCGVFNPGGSPCTKHKGHNGGHDPAAYGPTGDERERQTRYPKRRVAAYANGDPCSIPVVLRELRAAVSLLDSQAVHYQLFAPCAEGEHTDCIEYSNNLRRDAQLVRCSCGCHDYDAATRMRDKCVERVREMAARWRKDAGVGKSANSRLTSCAMAVGADEIVKELKSLTLDQVEQEKR